jgi:acyl-coenzyme A synthetase/AMP-(fatty) acid ligase
MVGDAGAGWITGHSYIVYGPLANGCTSVMFESAPDYPDKDIWWEIVERYRVTVFYTAPTAIRACMKWGEDYPAQRRLIIRRPDLGVVAPGLVIECQNTPYQGCSDTQSRAP